ncbi:DNA topoisomerase IV subunit A [Kingella negevensis]|uniref:DNA topoisomerase IV subunit A n=1 Tax=Kingella negevensis TaxID=1522312 RepID=UPI00254DC915|nr:DNA topoisomerase IV subunit A [Kingella negevensis]MDK4680697.1 DNA topoisomerase IV subunit A [Kingella negevensis]MDK4681579.1 DNA topoisomerase IV subunit A [Kingella negevensis]MDK4691967.1 DNA topoisomerase IV subunit A [Kingella negevensis]MDK4692879.1 DNA topoisomerase IV subunit A [Kingella negevensis]MDK4699179.1 DNA topoisomerase IV subunit A [Kingella negevensis]
MNHETLDLAPYAERAYLEYAMSVVKGRALPAVQDGQKPVQRRILFAMKDMGLAHGAKPVKSARVVGEILGKYHPHGDSSAYEAMVRMAQDFTLRYPLIDGIGNFGSRDGDGAAAMRYTEARLTPIAELLLSEINQGTVDFVPNYDGAFDEPVSLPARLPMVLLNGASGIAVGMATEIPSHNLNEVTQAAIVLLKKPNLEVADLMKYCPAPDFAGGGHIITSAKDLQNIYQSGKGSVRVRARYEIDKMARGQWRVIVSELPPNTSAAKILAEIEEQTNPKPKAGKKQLNQDQLNTKKLMLDLIEKVRDESDSEHPVRLVFEPKSSRVEPEHFINTLMAQTSLEGNVSINLVMMGMDNRPAQKNLKMILQEWLDYRVATVTRRLQHRLDAVEKRIHILEGRMIAFLHIDEIIKVIRESDEPKADLIAKFNLTEIQAEDILEIRLRQLARLEGIKLESELNALREEQGSLQHLLSDENDKKKLIIKEMQADAKQFGDERRTLVEAAERATLTQTTADEPITLILSQKGWIRARAGHDVDLSQIAFKEGDDLQQVLETRTVQPVIVLDTLGRSYTIDPADVPKGRGDGVPVGSLIDVQHNANVLAMLVGDDNDNVLLANSGGYGFICKMADLHTRVKAGKAVMSLEANEHVLQPEKLDNAVLMQPESYIVVASAQNRLLAISMAEMKLMAKGRGLQLMNLQDDDSLLLASCVQTESFTAQIVGKRGGLSSERLKVADIVGKRGRKGKLLDVSGSLKMITAYVME